jgi:beta-galactosidase
MSLDKPASLVNQFADQVDIPGLNYMAFAYDRILREHPNWVIYGSESGAAVSTRGVYHLPLENYARPPGQQVSSYDVVSPYFGYPPDVEFEGLAKSPEAIGEFVWSGFDYLGEGTPFGAVRPETPGGVPSFARTSYYGMVDIAGFPKDRYYLYQSMWTQAPMAHILPHWNWPGREGQPIPVMVYTNAEEVELFLNGESLGRKKRFGEPVTLPVGTKVSSDRNFQSRFRLMWQVPYQPGRLRAVALRGGSQVAVKEVRTAGAPARIVLTPDRKRIAADGEDLLFVTARIEDKDGAPCPLADNPIQFRVEGAGIVAAVDNGNPLYLERFQTDRLPAFNGLALLMVRSRAGQSGPIRITAESAGLSGGQTTVTTGR